VIRLLGECYRNRRRLRALVFGAARLVLALAVFFGAVQAGARYFYCEGVGLSASDPCAGRAHGDGRCPFNSVDRQSIDCCTVIAMPAMPDGARACEHAVHPAGVSALMPVGQYTSGQLGLGETTLTQRARRWQKPPRPAAELRAQLMVFLT
jgi:hypothetical protein